MQSDPADSSTSRRSFLKAALAIPVALSVAPSVLRAAEATSSTTAAQGAPLPTRELGKTGRPLTMVTLGGMMNALSPEYLDIAWSMGIRNYDTADCYLNGRSETIIGEWLAKYPERRKEIYLVTKDHPKTPEAMLQMIDKRLAKLGTKYVDCFFIHGICERDYPGSLEWVKGEAFKKVVEELKSSGKCRNVGFSCHDPKLNDYLNAAAQGGFVDVIMLRYTPFYAKGDAFDLALDACHKAGIGLVAMKTMRNAKEIPKRLPEFDKLGLTTQQALLHAVWSDPRIAAICSMIENVGQMDTNTTAARTYKSPLKTSQIDTLRDLVIAHRRTYCPGCPSCDAFSGEFALTDIARYVTYYEQDGLLEARDRFHALPLAARDASKVDLAALREGCAFKTDYPEIMRRAERYFA